MSHTQARALRPAPSFARAAITATSLLLLLAVLAIVLFTMLRSPLKDDVAWLLYVARRWMAGRELYVDVVEVNPPLIVWISAIPIWIASALGIDAQLTAIPFFVIAVLACAWWTASLLHGSGRLFEDRLPVFATIGTVLLVVPAGDLGQREHLLVAAILPYLTLFARSLGGDRTDRRDALIAGVLAGLGCALKPRYAGVFVVLEALALMRGLRPFRIMPFAAGATMLAYAGLVALLCPQYLRRAVPLALALYGATDVPLRHLLADSLRLMLGQAVALLLWPNSARVIRSQVLTLRERAYVEAARVTGASQWRILFVHIAPNILPLSFVYAAIAIGWAIITEASVSFLGFGDSESVSWGYMLQDAFSSQALSRGQYAWFVPPGVCIILVVVAGFFISRGYEEVFMPRLRGR